MPNEFVIDVTDMQLGDVIRLADVPMPAGVTAPATRRCPSSPSSITRAAAAAADGGEGAEGEGGEAAEGDAAE
jgi:hypothetical protein